MPILQTQIANMGGKKLFSERLFLALERNLGAQVRVARFHNDMDRWVHGKAARKKPPRLFVEKLLSQETDKLKFGRW